jgi:transcription elongation factor Elf1
MQPVDVYYEWIDACEEVAKEQAANNPPPPAAHRPAQPAGNRSRAGLAPGEKYTDEDAGFIDDDDVDAEAEYADED